MIRNILAAIGAVFLLVTATPVVKWSAEAISDRWGRETGDVLVVLGGSMLVPGTGPHATMGEDTYLRCVQASWLARATRFRYVIVSGGDGLSQSMAQWLAAAGVPALQENEAHSTYQNALFTRRILDRLFPNHPPQIVLVTSDVHSRRARLVFERAGMHVSVIPAPDVIKRSSGYAYRVQGALTILTEVVKLGYYKVKGRL